MLATAVWPTGKLTKSYRHTHGPRKTHTTRTECKENKTLWLSYKVLTVIVKNVVVVVIATVIVWFIKTVFCYCFVLE